MRTILSEHQLISILNTKTPIDLLRDDYKQRLSHEADDGGFVSHRIVAKFLASNEREAMDKAYAHKQIMMLQARPEGDNYQEKDERWK